jgi:hypothetical protein
LRAAGRRRSPLTRPAARAEGWSIGTNFGLSVYNPSEGNGSLTSFSVPAGNTICFGFVPGMRVGFTGPGKNTEIFGEFGLQTLSGDGFSASGFQLAGNFQQAFSSDATAPFVDAGLGLVHQNSDGDSGTSVTLGAGFGVRNRIADGHGMVRGEVRLDYITESSSGGVIIIPSGTIIQIKLGFDLWMK